MSAAERMNGERTRRPYPKEWYVHLTEQYGSETVSYPEKGRLICLMWVFEAVSALGWCEGLWQNTDRTGQRLANNVPIDSVLRTFGVRA